MAQCVVGPVCVTSFGSCWEPLGAATYRKTTGGTPYESRGVSLNICLAVGHGFSLGLARGHRLAETAAVLAVSVRSLGTPAGEYLKSPWTVSGGAFL